MPSKRPATLGIEQLGRILGRHGYVSDPSMLTTLYLAIKLKKPLLVEGEAGCGKSIAADQSVLALFDEKLVRTSIELLFEQLASRHPIRQGAAGWEYVEKINAYVPAMVGNTVSWCKASKLMRHTHKGTLIRIRTRSGRELTATPNHSFFIYDESGPAIVPSSQLKPGVRTAVTRYLDLPSSSYSLSTEEAIEEPTFIRDEKLGLVPNSRHVTRQIMIPTTIPVEEELCYFLGLFAAEGSLNGRSRTVISSPQTLNAGVIPFLQRIGPNHSQYVDLKSHYEELHFGSLAFNSLLRSNFGLVSGEKGEGSGARVRQVPVFIFSAPKPAKVAFLRGCFDGDGWVETKRVCLGTSSRQLADGIALLLASLRIFCTIRYRRTMRSYMITVRPSDWLMVGFRDPEKQALLSEAVDKEKNYQALEVIPMGRDILNIVKKAYSSQPKHSKLVYTQTVGRVKTNLRRNGNIGLRTLRKIATQLNSDEIAQIAESGILWDEIVRIETVDYDGYVYDFEVPGPQNFMAGFGGIITHNTELAKALSKALGTLLIRLQCYEGLDSRSTLYEWDYLRQLLKIKMEEGRSDAKKIEPEIFSERFLLQRPLLKAVMQSKPPVLLIDELDRADEEFEGFLLEFLGEFQVTIPELGTFKAREPPIVIITSNRTRELGDGLRRRCLYLRVEYPSEEKELKIVKIKVPGINEKLAKEIIRLTQRLRRMETLAKKPGVAETIDWASALLALGREDLDEESVRGTLGCVVKTADELQHLQSQDIKAMITEARSS